MGFLTGVESEFCFVDDVDVPEFTDEGVEKFPGVIEEIQRGIELDLLEGFLDAFSLGIRDGGRGVRGDRFRSVDRDDGLLGGCRHVGKLAFREVVGLIGRRGLVWREAQTAGVGGCGLIGRRGLVWREAHAVGVGSCGLIGPRGMIWRAAQTG